MARQQLDAVIIPSSDPHLSEHLPGRWQGRAWLSGFTGSAGTLVATANFSGMWTDSRYWSQAEAELAGSGIELMKLRPGAAGHAEWLAATLSPGATVAVDAHVLGLAPARALAAALAPRCIKLRLDIDPLDAIWTGRPALPAAPVFEHVAPQASKSRGDKLEQIRAEMVRLKADAHFISALDDIAYLLNLRGADVSFDPVFLSHLLLSSTTATLFVLRDKLPPALRGKLLADGIQIAPYDAAATALAGLSAGSTLLVDPHRITAGMHAAVPATVGIVEADNPSTLAKSCKSDADIAHVRATMEQDGAALCEFFAWLEEALAVSGGKPVTEAMLAHQLLEARARRPGFISTSFATIAGFRENGAIVHYEARDGACATIEGNGLLLIDSGGQYLGGTTDITRMVAVGEISAEQKRDCTLVLKGLIALSAARYPRGIRSPLLDALARAPIWPAAIDYGHGTGHGVGYFLNVHEGPQSISINRPPTPQTSMVPGMITSIEPGIYRPGKWGVRIENLVTNVPAGTSEFGDFLQFETLTLFPTDPRCLDLALLTREECAWLDAYHATVRTRLAPHVAGAAAAWLERLTVPLKRPADER